MDLLHETRSLNARKQGFFFATYAQSFRRVTPAPRKSVPNVLVHLTPIQKPGDTGEGGGGGEWWGGVGGRPACCTTFVSLRLQVPCQKGDRRGIVGRPVNLSKLLKPSYLLGEEGGMIWRFQFRHVGGLAYRGLGLVCVCVCVLT